MKLVKGMIIGGMVSAGLIMMYGETIGFNKKKMMKQGKKMMHKMGIFLVILFTTWKVFIFIAI